MPCARTDFGQHPKRQDPNTMPKAYQLRIALRDFKPAIYRDVLVSPATPLPKLHKLIQAAMSGDNAHMYGFALPKKNERYYSVPAENRFDIPDPLDLLNSTNHETDFKLNDLLKAPKDKLLYLYDFGDDWEHIITLQAIVETESALPHLLQAEQGCPPEDCGGPSGAVYWASVWHDKAHEEHDIALDMFGRHEPGWLDVAALQKAVQKLQLKPRKKSISTPKET